MAVKRASLDYRKLQSWWKSCAQGACKELKAILGSGCCSQWAQLTRARERALPHLPALDNVLERGQPPESQEACGGLGLTFLGAAGCAVGMVPAGSWGTSRSGGVHGFEHTEDFGGDS